MPINIIDDAHQFLVRQLKGKRNANEGKHPWRRDWEFAVLHSLRVESYTMKILARESHALSEHEITLVRLAAILHDMCRMDGFKDDHATPAAEIAGKWLREHPDHPLSDSDIERVMEIMADHSNKGRREPDYSKAVLKDADTLDEIGVMSIFMASNFLEKESSYFFHDLRQRLIDVELPYCDKKLAILNTQGARDILQAKKAFLEGFVAQLQDELLASGDIGNMVT